MTFRSAFFHGVILLSITTPAVAQSEPNEPNETCETPAVITPGIYYQQSYNEYSLTPEYDIYDYDYYRVSVPPHDRLVFVVTRTGSAGYPAVLQVGARDTTGGCFQAPIVGGGQNSCTIVFDNTTATTRQINLLVHAYVFDPGYTIIDYTLDVRLELAVCAGTQDDAYEPPSSTGPTPMGFGTVSNLFAATNHEDEYSLRIPSGTTLLVRTDFLHASGDLDLQVSDSVASLTSTSTTDQELVLFTTTAAGPIDTVLVRVAPKAGSPPLCNTYALTIEVVAPAFGTSYCNAGYNGYGTEARILPSGSASIAANALSFTCQAFPGPSSCLLVGGTQQASTPFGDGYRCVGGTVLRLGTSFAMNRVATLAPDFTNPNAAVITPGTTWNYQVYYRDLTLPGGAGFNLTDAVSITMLP